jgi:Fe-S cluster assembly scaffold protein SufB
MADELRARAKSAAAKRAVFGKEIDLGLYKDQGDLYDYLPNLRDLSQVEQQDMLKAGIDVSGQGRTGTYIQKDHSVIHNSVNQDGLEVISITEAMEKYSWLQDYYWKNVAVDADMYTARAELHQEHGYFIRALPGVKTTFPVQACLYITQEGLVQDVHNIIIAEEGSELDIITGCTTAHGVESGFHIGVSEFYVKKNATITFTMVHNWAENVAVRPRTGTTVEEGGTFLSNYICMKPVLSLQMYPSATLLGKNSLARFHSILVAQPGSYMDVGSRVILRGEGSRAEIIARSITRGGYIMNRGHLLGEATNVKGHLECRGLMLSDGGVIAAIPELEARVAGAELSHEAAVGKINEEEIEYLMARGLSEEEATAAIVRGFLNIKIMGLPPMLEDEVQRAIELSEQSGL